MSDKKISALTGATTPLAGTELVPVVQSGETKNVSVNNLTAGKAVSAAQLNVDNIRLDNNAVSTTNTNGNLELTPNGTGLVTSNNRYRSIRSDGIGFQSLNSGDFFYSFLSHSGLDVYSAANGTAPLLLKSGGATRVSIDTAGNVTVNVGNLVVGTAGKGINFSANTHAAGMTSELLNWYEEGTWTPVIRGSGTAGTYELDANTACRYTRIGRQVTLTVRIRLADTVTGGGTGDLYIDGVPFAKSANQIAVGSVYLAVGTFTGNLPTVVFDSLEGTSSALYFPQNASGGYGTSLPVSFASANAYIGFTLTYTV